MAQFVRHPPANRIPNKAGLKAGFAFFGTFSDERRASILAISVLLSARGSQLASCSWRALENLLSVPLQKLWLR